MQDEYDLTTSTSDLHDAAPDDVRVVDLQFRRFGQRVRFRGRCVPLKTRDSHRPVLEALRQGGRGKVLVVDGGGSMTVGLMGDRLAAIAVENGWVGIILNGVIRDSAAIDAMPIGVLALGTTARRSLAEPEPWSPGPVTFGGVTFREGDWVHVDEDAVIASDGQP